MKKKLWKINFKIDEHDQATFFEFHLVALYINQSHVFYRDLLALSSYMGHKMQWQPSVLFDARLVYFLMVFTPQKFTVYQTPTFLYTSFQFVYLLTYLIGH